MSEAGRREGESKQDRTRTLVRSDAAAGQEQADERAPTTQATSERHTPAGNNSNPPSARSSISVAMPQQVVDALCSNSNSNKSATTLSPSATMTRPRPSSSVGAAAKCGQQLEPASKSASRASLLSDTATTLSVCSLSSSVASSAHQLQARRAAAGGGAPRNAPGGVVRKSASSLSASSVASARRPGRAHQQATVAPGQISFSGIRRPGPSAQKSLACKERTLTSTSTTGGGGSGSASNISVSSAHAAAAGSRLLTTPKNASTSTTGAHNRASLNASLGVGGGGGGGGPTLAMSLREKDQQIKLLIRERDERRVQAEMAAQKAQEWREKYEASELERSHVTSEADDEVVELRRLAQEFEDENRKLSEKLIEREQALGDAQFKHDELECERQELNKELELREAQLREWQHEQQQLLDGAKSAPELITERQQSRAKYERAINELNERITCRDEQLMQLRSSLEMRKQEVSNLQKHTNDLETKLRIECERSEHHLKRIDEINLELKAAEAKLATKSEANEMQESQLKQLRHELRQAEEKLEQLSLARKKDVELLHQKLAAVARRGSTTPGASPACGTPTAFKTPTSQDEIVRLQMELRDLKDQLIDREAELDCNRRDLDVMRRKMGARTLEVDCNNQELARRCQDLLEQNRQSEDTIKQLLKSTTEHSASLVRATEDLKEANGKCLQLREEINQLEAKLDEQMKRNGQLARENSQLVDENEERLEQIELLRNQLDGLNEQISELCLQLDLQAQNLHKDREQLADQLSEREICEAQLRHDLAAAKQDLRTQKLVQQEATSERDRARADLELKDEYIRSRNDIIETIRCELDTARKSLVNNKAKLDELRNSTSGRELELEASQREVRQQLDALRKELQLKSDECVCLSNECVLVRAQLEKMHEICELEADEKFDEMRRKHARELDELLLKMSALESNSRDQQDKSHSSIRNQNEEQPEQGKLTRFNGQDQREAAVLRPQTEVALGLDACAERASTRDAEYETQIEFLNSLVVDMQRKCDDYKSRLAQMESNSLLSEFDKLLAPARLNPESSGSSTASSTSCSSSASAGGGGGGFGRLALGANKSSSNSHQHNKSMILNNNNNNNNNNEGELFANSQTSTLKRATNDEDRNQKSALKNPQNDRSEATLTRQRVVRIQDPLDDLLRQTQQQQQQQQQQFQTRPISGRPYCDLCQIYDRHHTIYCPKVNEKLANYESANSTTIENNNNNNNNNIECQNSSTTTQQQVDQMFREYEESLQVGTGKHHQFSSLRRPVVQQQQQKQCQLQREAQEY